VFRSYKSEVFAKHFQESFVRRKCNLSGLAVQREFDSDLVFSVLNSDGLGPGIIGVGVFGHDTQKVKANDDEESVRAAVR
ncbi:MAG: hypothetical protein ACREDR_41895, partial [Blastocatellia bacterium]